MIIPWVTGISLFLQLSCLRRIEGITITNQGATSSHFSVDNSPLSGHFSVDVPSTILQTPRYEHYDFHGGRADEVRVKKKKIGNYAEATDGVIPLGWEQAQAGRKYLPPRPGVVDSYGPPGVVPIEGGSPLYTPSYSSQSWNTHSYVRQELHRHLKEEENRGRHEDAKRHGDSLLENTKPVYELTNDEASNDERDYENKRGPEGNRAREQSTSPNTVTSLGHHRPTTTTTTDPHEFPRDASASAAGTSLSTLDWFVTDDGYNSELHPPPNPIISLILSHYGRYLPGTHQPKIYSYMAVNNIHNNRPFGQYKLSCDEGPDSQLVK